ncbi:MAG TPA: protealysin inhibitor emfourin [Chryseosolibacter sp.]
MKIKVTREGGIIPQIAEKQMDVKDLPEELQKQFRDFSVMPKSRNASNPLLRDGYKYTFEWGGKTPGKVEFDEQNIPSSLRPLIKFLMK